jgi:TRAP-type C4-dicarboxylate transport system permease large subunit
MSLPFFLMMVVTAAMITFWPGIVMVLPDLYSH